MRPNVGSSNDNTYSASRILFGAWLNAAADQCAQWCLC